MRLLRLVLVGGLALTAPIVAQAGPLGSTTRPDAAGPAPGSVVQVRDGNSPGWHPMPNGWNGDWRRVSAPSRQWNGGSPRWWPNGSPSRWACSQGPVVPTYWVWGPSGGAFDYPFMD